MQVWNLQAENTLSSKHLLPLMRRSSNFATIPTAADAHTKSLSLQASFTGNTNNVSRKIWARKPSSLGRSTIFWGGEGLEMFHVLRFSFLLEHWSSLGGLQDFYPIPKNYFSMANAAHFDILTFWFFPGILPDSSWEESNYTSWWYFSKYINDICRLDLYVYISKYPVVKLQHFLQFIVYIIFIWRKAVACIFCKTLISCIYLYI